MRRILVFLIIWPQFILCFSCSGNKSREIINDINVEKLIIAENVDNELQIDSIFSKIVAIPLETKDDCVISQISKAIFFDGRIYIQNERDNLFVFDTLGKYLFSIGKKGRGPGEFSVLRDFDVDENGQIFILDFLSIVEYNNDGSFVKKYSFHFTPKDKLLINPIQFAIAYDNDFFIWGGSFSIKSNSKDLLSIMYKMSRDGHIKNKYFPLNYKLPSDTYQFKRYKNIILIDPIFGSNVIYSIDNKDYVEARYQIDFGQKNLDKEIPSNFESLSEFKESIDSKYYHSISGFYETDEWIYFRFLNSRHFYNVYYSKSLKKSFVSKPYPRVKGRIAPWIINGFYEDKLISFIEPIVLNQDIRNLDENTLTSYEKEIFQAFNQKIDPANNPILLICTMRQYDN